MRTAPVLLGDAIAHGLLEPDEVLAGRGGVRPVSSSNHVYCVERAGMAVAYVKQSGAATRLDGDDCVATEARVLLAAARLNRSLAPVLLAHDQDTIWMRPIHGLPLTHFNRAGWTPEQRISRKQSVTLDGAAAAVGEALAALHQTDCDLPSTRPPWPLLAHLGREEPASMGGAADDEVCARVREAAREAPVNRALAQAAESWRGKSWIHGDVAVGNIFISAGDPPRAHFVDFEHSGVGEPGWDLVSAFAVFADLDPSRGHPAVDVLHQAYVNSGGPGVVTPGLWCARELTSAWQTAAVLLRLHKSHERGPLEHRVRELIARSRSHAEQGK